MCSGPAQLAAVRREQQPGRARRSRKAPREVGGAAAALVVGEPEADHAAAGVLTGEPGQGAGVERVPGPVGGDHHGHPEPGRRRGLADRVEHQVGERGDAAEAGAVPARVDLDLQPAAAVAHVVLGGLAHQPAYVVLGAQHRPRHVVQPLEAEPALLVGRGQRRRPLLDQLVGQHDAVAGRELEQRRVPHRPREVQVQVRLRQLQEVTHRGGPRSGHPSSFSAAASSTQVATASIDPVTSSRVGKEGASRMLVSSGSRR